MLYVSHNFMNKEQPFNLILMHRDIKHVLHYNYNCMLFSYKKHLFTYF